MNEPNTEDLEDEICEGLSGPDSDDDDDGTEETADAAITVAGPTVPKRERDAEEPDAEGNKRPRQKKSEASGNINPERRGKDITER